MKRLIFAFAVIAAWFCSQAVQAAAAAECFATSSAVFAAHPNATHASYTAHGKRSGGSGRCWFADAFKTEAKANPRPTPRLAATVDQTFAPRPAIAVPAPRPRSTAFTRGTGRTIVQFPRVIPPAIQIAVNAQELSRLLPDDGTPADFESRFSVSGYKARK
jgi:hypothetical protein